MFASLDAFSSSSYHNLPLSPPSLSYNLFCSPKSLLLLHILIAFHLQETPPQSSITAENVILCRDTNGHIMPLCVAIIWRFPQHCSSVRYHRMPSNLSSLLKIDNNNSNRSSSNLFALLLTNLLNLLLSLTYLSCCHHYLWHICCRTLQTRVSRWWLPLLCVWAQYTSLGRYYSCVVFAITEYSVSCLYRLKVGTMTGHSAISWLFLSLVLWVLSLI